MPLLKKLSQRIDQVHDNWDRYEEDFLSTQMQTSYFDFAALPSDLNLKEYLNAIGEMGAEECDYRLSQKTDDAKLKRAIAVEMMTASAIANSHKRFQSYALRSEDFRAFMQAFKLAAPKEGSGLNTITQDATGGHFIGHQPMADFAQHSYKNIIAYNPKKVPYNADLSAVPEEIRGQLLMIDVREIEKAFDDKQPLFDGIRAHEAMHSIQFATVPTLHARFANATLAPTFLTMHARTDMRTQYLYEVDAYFKMSYLFAAVQGYEQDKNVMERALTLAKEQAKASAPIDIQTFKRMQNAESFYSARIAKKIAAHNGESADSFFEMTSLMQEHITFVELDEATIRQIGASGTGGRYNTFTENFEPDAPIRAEFLQLTFPLLKGLRSKFAEKASTFVGSTPAPIGEILKDPNEFLTVSKGTKDQLSFTTHAALHRMGYKFKKTSTTSMRSRRRTMG